MCRTTQFESDQSEPMRGLMTNLTTNVQPHPILTVADRQRWARLIARDFQNYLGLDPASRAEVINHHPDKHQRAAACAARTFLQVLVMPAGEDEATRFSAPINKLEDVHD